MSKKSKEEITEERIAAGVKVSSREVKNYLYEKKVYKPEVKVDLSEKKIDLSEKKIFPNDTSK